MTDSAAEQGNYSNTPSFTKRAMNRLFEWATWQKSSQENLIRMYIASLRDNLRMPLKENSEEFFEDILGKLDRLAAKDGRFTQDDLGNLFAYEVELWQKYDDETAIARFWSVLDRFERIVPLASRNKYTAYVQGFGDGKWNEAQFVRRQASTLIDAIQNNFLLNMTREYNLTKLRASLFGWMIGITVIFLAAFAIMSSLGKMYTLEFCYLSLFVLGMLGASVSYLRRLQAATSHDAQAGDGLAELIEIGGNRISSLASLVLGGFFAILLYWLVASSLLGTLVPLSDSASVITAGRIDSDLLIAAHEAERETLKQEQERLQKEKPPGDFPAEAAERLRTLDKELLILRTEVARARAERISLAPEAEVCACPEQSRDTGNMRAAATGGSCPSQKRCSVGKTFAAILNLSDARSFYLLLVLAFLAGFGEKLVPDALDRVAKRFSPTQ